MTETARKRPRVVVLRGHLTNPWDLQSWQHLRSRFDVVSPVTRSNMFEVRGLPVEQVKIRTLRDFLPPGRGGDILAGLTGDRYFKLDRALDGADIVHAAELSFWFASEAARLKRTHGYMLVLTVWETLPLLSTFRNRWARVYRERVLEEGDLFLAATERARDALLLEGVEPDRIEISYPGIDLERFGAAQVAQGSERPEEYVLISPGRLVWEKGHQDVMRAVAALRRGIVTAPAGVELQILFVGSGPEKERLRAYAEELGLGGDVEFRAVSYEEMPALYARASCMVLASLSNAGGTRYLGDLPHFFWEEQFGLVLAEAMAAGLPIVASSSGAIPEVVGPSGEYFVPGDWMGLARKLAEGPLARPAGERVSHSEELVRRYSTVAASERLAGIYDRLLEAKASS
jgi:glycosyltransferase involved in cell wall biosynthesis